MSAPLTLSQLNNRISAGINSDPSLQGVWVVAETSDVRVTSHCYLELVEKDPSTGSPTARLRANIWRNNFARMSSDFTSATGRRFESGIKVMVKVNVSYHPVYGMAANIIDIDPSYTLGDLMRLRREILERLKAEGVISLNRSLPWPEVPLRIAVISGAGAAGYGDFIHQLYSSPSRLAFKVRLFPATVQGVSAPASIISALDAIAAQEDQWDCVVIIRGGGATTDLAAFENYDLAANIAQFPLPVIIGIGHERDITVLDYVANMRVKTPTAAAEWLIARGQEALDRLNSLASAIYTYASDLLAGHREQLGRIEATIPHLPQAALSSARHRLSQLGAALSDNAHSRLRPEYSRLDRLHGYLVSSAATQLSRSRDRLDRLGELASVLSPASTLARGYSITRVDGHAVTSAQSIRPGTRLVTTLADGSVISTSL